MTGKDEDRGVTGALKISQFVGVYNVQSLWKVYDNFLYC